tara:strand:+ start:140 stop:1546 length:1407 start_codon:yes stop_codon:yes gene_type:complete
MNIRNKIVFVTILLLLNVLPVIVQAKQSNIIFMLSDDQSWSGLSFRMNPDDKNSMSIYDETPNLKILASEGTRFTNAYAPSPVCSPSRASIQTGKSPARLNWTKAAPFYTSNDKLYLIPPNHSKDLSKSEITIGEMLKQANYKTAHFGKWHLLGGGPKKHGYDVSDGNIGNKYASKFVDPNPVDLFGMIERAERFIDISQNENKPFYIQLSFHALHYPENALKDTILKYNKKFKKDLKTREINRLAINENMDSAIGRLIKYLKNKNLYENTFLIFMADNGAYNRFSSLKGGKGALWEGGIRVPFIIKGPTIPMNAVNNVPIIGYDLFPTLMHISGLENSNADLDGINIFDTFKDAFISEERPTKGLIFHFPHYQNNQKPASAIIMNNWKLIKSYEKKVDLLFNLKKDPSEKINLINEEKLLYKKLLYELEKYLFSVNASYPKKNPKFDANALVKSSKKIKMKKKKKKK